MSIVVPPWRAAWNAARWKGHAAHSTTGVDSANMTHSRVTECIIVMAMMTTGTASTAATISRRSRVGSL